MRIACCLLIALTTTFLTSCYEMHGMGAKTIFIDTDCSFYFNKTAGVSEVDLKSGDIITWANKTGHYVTFVVDDAKILGGRRTLRLQPGESASIRVGTRMKAAAIWWHCWQMDEKGDPVPTEGGEGGGPIRVPEEDDVPEGDN